VRFCKNAHEWCFRNHSKWTWTGFYYGTQSFFLPLSLDLLALALGSLLHMDSSSSPCIPMQCISNPPASSNPSYCCYILFPLMERKQYIHHKYASVRARKQTKSTSVDEIMKLIPTSRMNEWMHSQSSFDNLHYFESILPITSANLELGSSKCRSITLPLSNSNPALT
jgi:hypothetical protein